MRRRHYLRAVGGSTTAAMLGLAGCSSLTGDGGDEVTMELWHDKGQNPNWNPVFDATLPVLNDGLSDENISVEAVPYQSTDSFQGAIRPVLGTEDGPGAFSWWTGARLRNIINDGFTHDITDVWQTHIDNGEYTEQLMETFGQDGTAYAIPNQVSYWVVWYNKQTFEDLGVSPPSTWDEFTTLCADIQSASDETDPIAIPLNPSWTGFIWFEELVARQSVDFYNQLCQGEAQYTDDISVQALEMIGSLVSEGYFGEASTAFSMQLDDLPRVLGNGDYAMTLLGSWISGMFSGDDVDFSDYGWFALPSVNPDVGQQMIIEPGPFVMHAGYPDADALEAVADGLLSVEFQQAWDEELNALPVNAEVDSSFLPDNLVALADAVSSGDYSFPLRYWENTSPDVAVPASQTLKRIFQDPDDASGIAAEVERTRENVYD